MGDPPPSVSEPVGTASEVSDPKELSRYAVQSYRYLRIAILVILVTLIGSVLLERANAPCWEESISTYFYTPVHSIFVGTLVALGVCLIAIRGSTEPEEVLLNIAGVLAPIVAFVPTSRPATLCTTNPAAGDNTLPYINNNLVAFGLALVLAVVVGMVTMRVEEKRGPEADALAKVGIAASGLLLAAGIIWYVVDQPSFLDRAHGGGAIALFALVGVVVFINGFTSPTLVFKVGYLVIAAAMLLTFVVVFIIGLRQPDWGHDVLVIELIELSLLLVFWTMQTVELWNAGVPTGSKRAARSDAARSSPPGRFVAMVARVGRRHEGGPSASEKPA